MKQLLLNNDKLIEVISDFMNGVVNEDQEAFETAVRTLKEYYGLKPEQEAMVRIILMHLEAMAEVTNGESDMLKIVGLDTNVLKWVVAEDYDMLNRKVLHDFDPSAS